MHNGSRIIKMAVVATPNVRRRDRQTETETDRDRDTETETERDRDTQRETMRESLTKTVTF